MSNEFSQADMENFHSFFAEGVRWASLYVSIKEIARDNNLLVLDLKRYNPSVTIPFLAGLLTLPKLQSHCIRLEILIALAVVYCRGQKKAKISDVFRWFSQIDKSKCVTAEDPPEDVFVSLVRDSDGDYRILEGVWEAAGFYTQQIIDVITTMPDSGQFGEIKKIVRGLLTISDLVCEKAGLNRYQLGSDDSYKELSPRILPKPNMLISCVTISFSELNQRDVKPNDIEPFFFHPEMREDLLTQQIGLSYLDRCPLMVNGRTKLTVVLPTAISVALRDFVLASIIKGKMAATFDDILAHNYSKLFYDTPLLGGPMRAPVHWIKSGDHRWASFNFKIDEGFYISFHLFLPSVQTHPEGGFKNPYLDDGTLTKELEKSIDGVVKHFEGKEDFKKGLIVIVGCGWGKGYVIENLKKDNRHWRFENMSAADLVRLSWLGNMNPGYFWRIQDGLEAVNKAGVEIINPNGILNLIGWVRKNDGHFVPHAALPEGEISPDRPLLLELPLNLLREVRADSDSGYDRHSTEDNLGTRHDVQHKSPTPFFSSESERRVYVSWDDVGHGKLTSVYEGIIHLWISVSAPNISSKDLEYRLWEMSDEWLHRLGKILDKREEALAKSRCLKVYVEFHDKEPPEEVLEKPTYQELLSRCFVEPHDEPNACKAVFKKGYMAGFRIAENVAERLFVRTLAKAYLHLLKVTSFETEAEIVETLVVPNEEARSIHFFVTRRFIDYVRDTLPKKLIAIDPLDDAATKIGLGWRILGKDKNNKIEGREACTEFLGKVVDVLLAEISEMLKPFDRLSMLKRLVSNCEKANEEKDHWKRTSAAVLGLHGEEPNTADRYVKELSKFAGADIASRILIEIALCVWPAGPGGLISDIELSKLIARAALVARIGGFSDAIYYNAIAPELIISPLGDILFRDEFGSMVVEPMLCRVIENGYVASASYQKIYYDEPEIVPSGREKIRDEFWEIWNIEMGFDLNDARRIIDALEDKGVNDHAAIFTIKQSIYLSIVCSENISENTARKFLDQFSLVTRPRWDKPPMGFNAKDIYPWRFGRRLSFATRPILKVDESDDPLLIIAPNVLRKGFVYVVDGAYSGEFEQTFFRSKEMRDIWWGKAHEGHSFNKQAAEELSEAGWQVRMNIGLPEILNCKIEQDNGDVDVLAWRLDRNEVLVIECKDLSLARNYSEVAAMLSDYQGVESAGKPDKLKRHINRVTLLQNNRKALHRFTGIQEPRIVSCLVCSGVVPMQYAKINALKQTHVGGISDILKALA